MAISVLAKLKVKAGSEAAFEAAGKDMIAAVRANEPGTLAYTLHKSVKDPTEFWFYEQYADQAALDAHGKTPHMREFGGKIGASLEGRPEIHVLAELARK